MRFNKKIKKVISVVSAFFIIFSFSEAFAAKSVSELKKEMEERNEQIKQK